MFEVKYHGSNVNPRRQISRIGETVRFECYGSISYIWYYSREKENPKTEAIHYNSKYTIDYVNTEQTGYYYCLGKSIDNGEYFMEESELLVLGKQRN